MARNAKKMARKWPENAQMQKSSVKMTRKMAKKCPKSAGMPKLTPESNSTPKITIETGLRPFYRQKMTLMPPLSVTGLNLGISFPLFLIV